MEHQEYYKNPLNGERQSDIAMRERLAELKTALKADGKLMEAAMDQFAMQDKDAYNLVKIILGLNYQVIRTGEVIAHRDIMCQELAAAIYAHINEVRHMHETQTKKLEPIIKTYHDRSVVDKWFSSASAKITMIATLIGSTGFLIAWASGILNGG